MHRIVKTCLRSAAAVAAVPAIYSMSSSHSNSAAAFQHSEPSLVNRFLRTIGSGFGGHEAHCESLSYDSDTDDTSYGHHEEAEVVADVEDFDDVEHSRSFPVNDVNGVNIMLMTALTGVNERERASAGVQIMIDKGYHTMYIYSDDRNPTLSAVFQPGPEGHILRLVAAQRYSNGISTEVEGQFDPKTVYALKGTVKARTQDYLTSLGVSGGKANPTAEFSYHQRITPSITAGGTLSADLAQLTPFPKVTGLTAGVFGSYHQDKNTWLLRYNAANATGTLRLHRQSDKNVELGAYCTLNTETLESSAGVGCKLGLGKEGGGAMPSSFVTVNASTDHKVAISWSSTMFSQFSSTQMLTVLTASMDHRKQEHSIGAQFQFHY